MGLFARMLGVGRVLFLGRRDGDVTRGQKRIHQHTVEANIYIPTFNMFIIIHETIDTIAEMKQLGVLIFWWRALPATSYVATTFHPTMGQRAHQSLSKTATPELGMIPQGIRVNAGLHIAKVCQHTANSELFLALAWPKQLNSNPKPGCINNPNSPWKRWQLT